MVPYFGSYLVDIDHDGRLQLPAAIMSLFALRSTNWAQDRKIMLAPDLSRQCLLLTDRDYVGRRFDRIDQGLVDYDAESLSLESLGLLQTIMIDGHDTFVLPAFLRARYRIGRELLLVGAGGTVELWSPAMTATYHRPDLAFAIAAGRQARIESGADDRQNRLPLNDVGPVPVMAHR